MFLFVPFAAGAVIALVTALVLSLRLTAPPTDTGVAASGTVADLELVTAAYRRARPRALSCVAIAAVLLVAGTLLDQAAPGLLGLPLALAPGLAASAALLTYALLPVSVRSGTGPSTASLTRRTAWSFGSRRGFVVPAAASVGFLIFLGWATAVADPDDRGRMRAITFTNGIAPSLDGAMDSTASPFPGGFYAIPLAVVTVLLAATTYLALRRIASIPTLPVPMQSAQDRHWRTASTTVATRLATAALLGYAGGTAVMAGTTVGSAARSMAANGVEVGGATAGVVLVIVGGVALVVGVALAIGAAFHAATLRPENTLATAVAARR